VAPSVERGCLRLPGEALDRSCRTAPPARLSPRPCVAGPAGAHLGRRHSPSERGWLIRVVSNGCAATSPARRARDSLVARSSGCPPQPAPRLSALSGHAGCPAPWRDPPSAVGSAAPEHRELPPRLARTHGFCPAPQCAPPSCPRRRRLLPRFRPLRRPVASALTATAEPTVTPSAARPPPPSRRRPRSPPPPSPPPPSPPPPSPQPPPPPPSTCIVASRLPVCPFRHGTGGIMGRGVVWCWWLPAVVRGSSSRVTCAAGCVHGAVSEDRVCGKAAARCSLSKCSRGLPGYSKTCPQFITQLRQGAVITDTASSGLLL